MNNRVATGVAAALAIAVLAGCGGKPAADAKQSVAPVVTVAQVAPEGAAGEVRATGTVGYKRETVLSFKVPGVISRLRVDEGDKVGAGQVLASLNLTEYAASTSESTASLRTAESQLARAKTLFEKGLVAQARLDDAQLAVDRAKAAQQATSFNQSQGVIVAPAAGVILRRSAEPNQNIGAGQPVLLLGETRSGLIVRAGVSSSDAIRIKVGDKASVDVGAGAARTGVVRRVAAKSDALTGGFDVEIEVTPTTDLRSGLVAAASIKASGADGAPGALRAPALALLDARADQGVVYVVDAQDIARRRSVQTAGLSGESVLIVSGLAPGERIITSGAAFVQDGEKVSVAPAPAPTR